MLRVLVATDGSDLAMAAAQRAESLLPSGTHYTVLAVVRPPTFVAGAEIGVAGAPSLDLGDFAANQQTGDAEGDAAATTTAALLAEAASERVVHGDPGTVICQIAEDEAFDLIVVGSTAQVSSSGCCSDR